MLSGNITTELVTFKASMIRNLETFIDYFLDDVTKQIIRKYDFEEFEEGYEQTINQNLKIRIIGIKVFILYQNSVKKLQLFRLRLVQTSNKYIKIPICNSYQTIKSHPLTVFTIKTILMINKYCQKKCLIIYSFISHCLKEALQKIKKSKLKAHAEDATNRLKRVIEAAYCYTKDNIVYKTSSQLYNYVQGKYSQLKKKFISIKKEGQVLTERIASQNSCESFMFPQPLEKLNRYRILKVKSNQNLMKKYQKSKHNKNKIYEIVDEQQSSLQMSQRKPSMSQCGGYSSQQQL